MLSEAELIAKRATLRWLVQQHPMWTQQDLADALKMSRSWISKWLRRLRQADPADVMALHSRSRARHTAPFSLASQPAVVQRILQMRMEPPENLQRVPGPEALLYFVHSDPELKAATVRLPRSQTTIWKILRQAGCIAQDRRRKSRPLEVRQPGEEVQFELKDESLVPADPGGKRAHVVEVANFVDAGTSIWLHHQVGAISMPKRSSSWWPSFCASMAYLPCSPLIMTHVWSAVLRGEISRISPWCASCSVLECTPMSSRRTGPI